MISANEARELMNESVTMKACERVADKFFKVFEDYLKQLARDGKSCMLISDWNTDNEIENTLSACLYNANKIDSDAKWFTVRDIIRKELEDKGFNVKVAHNGVTHTRISWA